MPLIGNRRYYLNLLNNDDFVEGDPRRNGKNLSFVNI